jgi:hypothetical protein
MGEGYIYKGEGQEISGGEKANVFEWRFSPIVFSKVWEGGRREPKGEAGASP